MAELALGNALYLDLAFLASRTLCAIGENDAVFFSIDGKQTGIYDYEGAYLTHYSLDGSGFVAVADEPQPHRRHAGPDDAGYRGKAHGQPGAGGGNSGPERRG